MRNGSRRAAAERLRNTKERESEGREVMLGTLLKLLVKDKLLHSGKVPVNAELRLLRREKKTEVVSCQEYFSQSDEDVTEYR